VDNNNAERIPSGSPWRQPPNCMNS
jgi:hypothetical protein